MKKIISKDAAFLLETVAVLLLLSLLIAFLYMLDWIGTGLFTMITQLIGLLIYTAAAFFFLRWFPKRILLFALLACIGMTFLYGMTQPWNFRIILPFFGKLFVFLSIILLLKGKRS